MGHAHTQSCSLSQPFFILPERAPCGGKRFPVHIATAAAERLQREQKLETWTMENGPMILDLFERAPKEGDFWMRCGCLLLMMMSCGESRYSSRTQAPTRWSSWMRHVERPFHTGWTPRDCVLDTVLDLRCEVDEEMEGREIGGRLPPFR